MVNVAAICLLTQRGSFGGFFDSDPLIVTAFKGIAIGVDAAKKAKEKKAEEEWGKQPERFADIQERSPLIENYLKGGTKLFMNIDYNDDPSLKVKTSKGFKTEMLP